mmetsp:Transcript_73839/g.213906  ORF Transcript_73839/g.213906 Transcript_73839/m.213906 type:complete len:224 (+) Transcript_73839:1077-1748(+)
MTASHVGAMASAKTCSCDASGENAWSHQYVSSGRGTSFRPTPLEGRKRTQCEVSAKMHISCLGPGRNRAQTETSPFGRSGGVGGCGVKAALLFPPPPPKPLGGDWSVDRLVACAIGDDGTRGIEAERRPKEAAAGTALRFPEVRDVRAAGPVGVAPPLRVSAHRWASNCTSLSPAPPPELVREDLLDMAPPMVASKSGELPLRRAVRWREGTGEAATAAGGLR